jgi:maleylacetoacetate isomerase
VRIALHLKNLNFQIEHVNLLKSEQQSPAFLKHNPQGFVPALQAGDFTVSQSMAIIEYLDETHPDTALVYGDAQNRAIIRQMAQIIACEIAPLNIPKVWKGYLGAKLNVSEPAQIEWMTHWIHEGLTAYEAFLSMQNRRFDFSCGDLPSLADLCLIPQLYNARRFHIDLSPYPHIQRIEKNCIQLDAFQKAAPESHPHAPPELEQIHGPTSPLLGSCAA